MNAETDRVAVRRAISLICAVLAAWPGVTWVGLPSAHAAPNVKSAHDAADVAEATELVELARRRFKEGQFEVAAKLFRRCFELTGKPAMLFNVARAHEEAGQKALAIQAFRDYLAVSTDAAGREEARAHIECCRTQSPAQPTLCLAKPRAAARAARTLPAPRLHRVPPGPLAGDC